MMNEAVRLFFAVTALILVGMLSSPSNSSSAVAREIEELEEAKVTAIEKKISNPGKTPIKLTDRKSQRKNPVKKG